MHTFAAGMRRLGLQIDLHYLGELWRPSALLGARKEICNLAAEYDLVHAQFGSACAVVTAVAKIPKLLSLRGSDWHVYRERLNTAALHSFLATAMSRFAVHSYDLVIVMSHRMRSDLLTRFPDVPTEVLTDPIDLSRFTPTDKTDARRLLGAGEDASRWVLLTTLSTENPIKRVSLAEKAVAIANEKLGNVKLKVVTGIPYDQMPIFVASCDVVLSTSVHEGWPNCVKEGLACNLPFVATDVSDLAEIAAKETSCRVCPPDAEALAEGITHALMAPRKALRQHMQSMDLEPSCRRLFALYERVLNVSS